MLYTGGGKMILENLTLSFGIQNIFRNINLSIPKNEKLGIVGVNGAGKTTLFKIITGELWPDEGRIVLEKKTRIGLLPQVIDEDILNSEILTMDYLLSGRPISKLKTELNAAYNDVSNETNESKQKEILNKIAYLQQMLEYYDVYNAENIMLKIISGMGVDENLLLQSLNTLSGGQKSKIAFARLLYSKPEVILLDEPTNHLDKTSKDYVINFLRNYKGSVFIISHDTEFLDLVTSKTLYLDKRTKTMQLYNGNYSTFKKFRAEHDKAIERQAENQEKEIERLQAIVDKYATSSGARKRMAQDREKKLAKLLENKIEVAPTSKKVNIEIDINRESGTLPLKVTNLSFKYDKSSPKNIVDNLTFNLSKGEKFLIVGENGIGKSTLLKLIIGQLQQDRGIIEIGTKTDIGYYAQEHELLDNNSTILENFRNIPMPTKKLRAILGRFLFFEDDVFKNVSVLSPGERSRVALAKLALTGANMLILDEPTNHLDPETQSIIAETFREYSGTILIVSHNPEFVDNLGVERVLMLPSGDISYYNRQVVEYYQNLNSNSKKKE